MKVVKKITSFLTLKWQSDSPAKNSHSETDPLTSNERGATLVEYALMVALMAIGSMASIEFMREGAHDKFQEVGNVLGAGAAPDEVIDL